eukprot:scpid81520/ scgid34575/ 
MYHRLQSCCFAGSDSKSMFLNGLPSSSRGCSHGQMIMTSKRACISNVEQTPTGSTHMYTLFVLANIVHAHGSTVASTAMATSTQTLQYNSVSFIRCSVIWHTGYPATCWHLKFLVYKSSTVWEWTGREGVDASRKKEDFFVKRGEFRHLGYFDPLEVVL